MNGFGGMNPTPFGLKTFMLWCVWMMIFLGVTVGFIAGVTWLWLKIF